VDTNCNGSFGRGELSYDPPVQRVSIANKPGPVLPPALDGKNVFAFIRRIAVAKTPIGCAGTCDRRGQVPHEDRAKESTASAGLGITWLQSSWFIDRCRLKRLHGAERCQPLRSPLYQLVTGFRPFWFPPHCVGHQADWLVKENDVDLHGKMVQPLQDCSNVQIIGDEEKTVKS
jgi:hypothetical protein